MLASLKAFVSSGSTFPYTIGQPFSSAWGAWTHYRGTGKEDGSAVSIFKISAANANDPKLRAARNGVKRLKLVSNASVLSFRSISLRSKGPPPQVSCYRNMRIMHALLVTPFSAGETPEYFDLQRQPRD